MFEVRWTLAEEVLEFCFTTRKHHCITNCVFDHKELITQQKLGNLPMLQYLFGPPLTFLNRISIGQELLPAM